MVPTRKTNNAPLTFLLALLLLASTNTANAAKSFGGGSKSFSGGGSSSGGSKTSYDSGSSTGSFGGGIGKTSGATYGPVKSSGGGYANRNSFSQCGGYSGYPYSGYGRSFYSGFFLYSGYYRPHRHRNQNKNYENETSDGDDYNFEDFFERVVNGCQVVGVESYRTIDNKDNSNATWKGCSEEWHYNVEFVGNSTFTPADVDADIDAFVSPPLEFYACEEAESCADCKDELRGDNFYALTLEKFDFGNKTYLVDCYVPKNQTLVNETFNCTNEECVFLSEKYDYVSSSPSILAGSTMYWTMLLGSGIAVSMYSLMA